MTTSPKAISLTTCQLKWIALLSMLLDHTGIVFFHALPFPAYQCLRGIGRISFPIFCFLLTEGFSHTHDKKNYLFRLGIFALLSELPFDIALKGGLTDSVPGPMVWSAQNVFFTLFFGFCSMLFFERAAGNREMELISILLFPILAEIIQADYGALGVFTILFFYYRKQYYKKQYLQNQPWQPEKEILSLFLCLTPLLGFYKGTSFVPLCCFFAVIPLWLYHGKKGKGLKYLFYTFYPLHLLILYAISVFFSKS